ncbi:hypothetical protein P153DRAFT_397988 [Dothidotthia symphoricarpi CBS 119687]|uniref:Clr5 domain-containing protein n=1 Tax=Dothidotthia symphoricarpi CBS 119687 TaxID=1392245 RepID=A0A6A6AB84_9PLEO|nr:uncharacterized protein P153DRAFT_397988 [Dothidotthia symphoricarpi CBS 119687]KAF2128127.1 hypothetical protein P153DRAFT_397988 [Dothidotthia symphoricarpi CBS 119687]
MDNPETSPPSSIVAQRRRRSHAPMTWAKIQSSLQYYYIDLDMTLGDAMQKIGTEHNFYATEQMYKKRLKAWGLSKQVKSDEKEKALARILQNETFTSDHVPVRHDKLVRYAKSRVKSGALDSHHLRSLTRRHIVVSGYRHAATEMSSMPRSLALPGQFAGFDVFLRAMQALIERERREWLTGWQTSPDAIFSALSKGMSLWRNNAFAAARISFGQAAQRTVEDLQGTEVSVSRITYCISSILWGAERELVFRKFAEFMANAALEVLGPRCPMTVVLRHLQREQSVDAQVRIWACALDGYQISEQNVQHWWNMAQRRWRWCWRSGKLDLAAQYCRLAMSEARRIDRLTVEMESEAQHDLESIVLEAST